MSRASTEVALQVLGPPGVRLASGEPVASGVLQPRRLATLAYLVLARPRGLHMRDTIVALLWPEADQAGGRHALRNCLHALRQALGEDLIITAGDGLVGVDAARVECDALALEAELAAGRVEEALARHAGDLLAGFHVSEAPEFERWLDEERRRLRDAVAAAAWARSDALRAAGDPTASARLAQQAHALAPDDELSLRKLLVRLDDCGDRAGAVRAYDEFARRIEAEFGAPPSPDTVALAERLRARPEVPAPARLGSLAVLPFTDRSGREEGAELVEGLGAGIANRLARVARFRVTARSVVPARPAGSDVLAVGRELGVEAVVTGVLATTGGQLRLRLEVVRVADGRLLLGDAFSAEQDDLVMLEAHVALAVCRALGATSADQLELVAHGRPPRRGEAHVLYVRGQHAFWRAAAGGHPDALERCREFFEQALALDPGYAPAVAGLSNYYAVAGARNHLRPFEAAWGRAIALSHEALALDPAMAIPHVHLGVQAMYLDGDWGEAERRFRRVRELDPSYAEGHRFLAILRSLFGRHEEALALHAEAARLEPRVALHLNGLAAACMDLRRYGAARHELERALALDPGYRAARERLIRCHERLGDFAAAVAERRNDPAAPAERFAEALAAGGPAGYLAARAVEVRATIPALAARVAAMPDGDAGDRYNPPELRLALAYAELGEWDAAFAWEERAAAVRPWRRQWFLHHPELAPLAGRRR